MMHKSIHTYIRGYAFLAIPVLAIFYRQSSGFANKSVRNPGEECSAPLSLSTSVQCSEAVISIVLSAILTLLQPPRVIDV